MDASQDPFGPARHGALPRHVPVLVIGAGFAGIGAAAVLGRAGYDVLVLERADRVGGTWRDNRYPGCACDVPSALYSFSFAPSPRATTGTGGGWSRRFAAQPEILAYLDGVVRRLGLGRSIRCGVEVLAAAWDEAALVWRVTTDAGTLTADVLISACGALSEPAPPQVPGLDAFGGPVLHTARWTPGTDLTGLRVAVVGTGASAVQVVPELARRAAELVVLQRTPPWILPRHDRPLPRGRARAPRLARAWAYTRQELLEPALVHRPELLAVAERHALAHLRRQVPDPGLRALLTPGYRLGCKRVLLSDDYYPALVRDTVELVPSALARLEPGAVVSADGARRAVDAVVLATGFRVSDPPIAHRVQGRDGVLLADAWRPTGMQALRGTTVTGFPNLFLLTGPNTGSAHTSMVHVIESQLRYVRDALDVMRERDVVAIEPTAAAQRAWTEDVRRRMRSTVWATGGCESWYADGEGRLTALWPGSSVRLRLRTRRLDVREYRAVRR